RVGALRVRAAQPARAVPRALVPRARVPPLVRARARHGDERLGGGMRLAAGGIVERARPLAFTFDGVAYEGLAGDTLAAALLANGVRVVSRSLYDGRPRGIFSAGPEEPNAHVEVEGEL